MSLLRLLVCSLVLSIGLSSCAIAPARVKRVMRSSMSFLGGKSEPSMPELLDKALRDPDSSEGKAALGTFIERWKKERGTESGLLSADSPETTAGSYQVRFVSDHSGAYPLSYFDQISPAANFEVRKLKHHRRDGIGTPMTALRENRHREPIEQYYPPEAITRPLTALARPGAVRQGVREVQIELLCPMFTSEVMMHDQRQSLAADFSVPWATSLARAGKLNQLRVLDMLTSKPKRQPQLYLMEPYDPNKEPLIMIHGLLSTPLAWAELSNELWADDAIRKRYQIWHYLYNTSAPALYSARLLRAQLKELRQQLDPDGRDPAMQKTTLLTHSMGGLVGKALAVEPGDVFWKAAFKVPPESLKLSSKDRAELMDAFEWHRDPTIHRIIYIAVPHRGSDFADNLIGRMGRAITGPPQVFREFYRRVSASNPGVFTPAYEELGRGKLDSVHSLSPHQPTLRIMADLPLASGVHVHCIMGDRGRAGPKENSSDGIVPYRSSHLEQVDSELMVPTRHRAFRHPQAIAEVERVLKLP